MAKKPDQKYEQKNRPEVIELKGDKVVLEPTDSKASEEIGDDELEEFDWDGHTLPEPVTDSKELALYQGDKLSSDPLHAYLRQISRYELLSAEQEKALIKALEETGDIEVAKKLVVGNLRLVVKIAMEYRSA